MGVHLGPPFVVDKGAEKVPGPFDGPDLDPGKGFSFEPVGELETEEEKVEGPFFLVGEDVPSVFPEEEAVVSRSHCPSQRATLTSKDLPSSLKPCLRPFLPAEGLESASAFAEEEAFSLETSPSAVFALKPVAEELDVPAFVQSGFVASSGVVLSSLTLLD